MKFRNWKFLPVQLSSRKTSVCPPAAKARQYSFWFVQLKIRIQYFLDTGQWNQVKKNLLCIKSNIFTCSYAILQ